MILSAILFCVDLHYGFVSKPLWAGGAWKGTFTITITIEAKEGEKTLDGSSRPFIRVWIDLIMWTFVHIMTEDMSSKENHSSRTFI